MTYLYHFCFSNYIAAPSDFDLMNGMMNKIAKLELQVQLYAKEVIEKVSKMI